MKTVLCSLLLAAGLLMAASTTEVQAQPCTWTFLSSVDCSINFQVFMTCPPGAPVAVSTLNTSSPGCWSFPPTGTPFTVSQCSPPIGCYYSVTLNGNFYSNGSIFCCNPTPPEDCLKCGCAYVNIDPINRTITLSMACSGEINGKKWDCCDDY